MKCNLCGDPTNKKCSRCKKTYYCSPSCQKYDYHNHVFKCPPKGGLKTADYLVKNVYDDEMPEELAVLHEYGFNNCIASQDRTMLLGLYIGLIKILDCSASKIHRWWKNGELPHKIKETYDEAGAKSDYYSWFLKNEHLLQGLHKFESEKPIKSLSDKFNAIIKPYLSDPTIPTESLPQPKRDVTSFYIMILMGNIPRIWQPHWIDFGFCTCKDNLNEVEELRLGDLYRELIVRNDCKVDEFHEAYLSGTVVDLLKRKCENTGWLSERQIEVFKYDDPIYSVYYLKQYALDDEANLQRSVYADYGFANCRTEDEKRQLRNLYKKLIQTPQFDPKELHKACIAGNIIKYVSSILPNETVRIGLFKNPYPLEDL